MIRYIRKKFKIFKFLNFTFFSFVASGIWSADPWIGSLTLYHCVTNSPTRNFPGSQPKKIRSTVEKFRLYFELVSNVHWTYRWYTWHQAEEQSFNIQLFPQLFFREIFFQKIFSFLNQYNSLKNVIYIHWIQILIKS